jgi:hypothetical protein
LKTIRIGCGAGYGGDRIDPAVDIAQDGDLDYLVLECLAERTVAMAQIAKKNDPAKGYGMLLAERMTKLLPICKEKGFKIVTNIGAANPRAALEITVEIARNLGLSSLKIAALMGADVLEQIHDQEYIIWETGEKIREASQNIISADAYLGAEQILPALVAGADVIITGRVADPSLFLAPMIYEFGWKLDDWHLLGQGTAVAHLLECSSQVTGGYFADPVYKKVSGLEDLGFPMAIISENGDAIITKLPGSGGMVTKATCKEQLLYEIHDPAAYVTPDVVADFTDISLEEAGPDMIRVTGGAGKPRPDDYKVTLGVLDGFIGEGTICYAGFLARERAEMAREILEARYRKLGCDFKRIKYDVVGINSLHGSIGANSGKTPYEVMLRVAAKTDTEKDAETVGNEVESLWINGPGGPGGAYKNVRSVVAAYSALVPRNMIKSNILYQEV